MGIPVPCIVASLAVEVLGDDPIEGIANDGEEKMCFAMFSNPRQGGTMPGVEDAGSSGGHNTAAGVLADVNEDGLHS